MYKGIREFGGGGWEGGMSGGGRYAIMVHLVDFCSELFLHWQKDLSTVIIVQLMFAVA